VVLNDGGDQTVTFLEIEIHGSCEDKQKARRHRGGLPRVSCRGLSKSTNGEPARVYAMGMMPAVMVLAHGNNEYNKRHGD
jgi:hypothetical protein